MYRPSHTINDDRELAVRLIQDFPLGLLVSQAKGDLESSYLPFLVEFKDNELVLTTHLARNNPQWKNLGEEVLVSFQGPNRYISPTMYKGKNNVPTWNYAAVQVRGRPEVLTSRTDLKEILNQSVEFFETRNETSWKYDLPEALQEKLESAIVGLKIRSKPFAKFKLSQNRNDADYESVLDFLITSKKHSDQELLQWMIKDPPAKKIGT